MTPLVRSVGWLVSRSVGRPIGWFIERSVKFPNSAGSYTSVLLSGYLFICAFIFFVQVLATPATTVTTVVRESARTWRFDTAVPESMFPAGAPGDNGKFIIRVRSISITTSPLTAPLLTHSPAALFASAGLFDLVSSFVLTKREYKRNIFLRFYVIFSFFSVVTVNCWWCHDKIAFKSSKWLLLRGEKVVRLL